MVCACGKSLRLQSFPSPLEWQDRCPSKNQIIQADLQKYSEATASTCARERCADACPPTLCALDEQERPRSSYCLSILHGSNLWPILCMLLFSMCRSFLVLHFLRLLFHVLQRRQQCARPSRPNHRKTGALDDWSL